MPLKKNKVQLSEESEKQQFQVSLEQLGIVARATINICTTCWLNKVVLKEVWVEPLPLTVLALVVFKKKIQTVRVTVQVHYKATCLSVDVLLSVAFYYAHCQQWTFCSENPPPAVKCLAEPNEENNSDIRLKRERTISFSSC